MSSTPAGKGAGKRAAELFTASGGDKQHAPRNIVKKLMNGEFSLTVTFWIFCVSVPLVGHLVFTRLLFPLLDLQSWHGSTAFLVWPLLALLYAAARIFPAIPCGPTSQASPPSSARSAPQPTPS